MPRRRCFVIMPFGEKSDASGQKIDFDTVYEHIIKPSIEDLDQELDIECVRCDEINQSGWVQSQMIERIYLDDVAVVDISTLNPNVFYELGVRHALRASVTVLIRKKGTSLPFNIQDLKAIDYDLDLQSADEAKKKIKEFIRNGLKDSQTDSLVHQVLPLRIGRPESSVIKYTEHFPYSLVDNPDKVIYITTGDLKNIRGIDIWVNSENTNMQMARFYDRSISSIIRYLGAEKDQLGLVVNDIIADELARIVGAQHSVPHYKVIPTTAGHLSKTHSVKRIFHAASVVGEIGRGYTPLRGVAECITNALAEADNPEYASDGLTSILFPLMGAGTARGDLRDIVSPLINAAIDYLRANRQCQIRCVHFLVLTDDELAACRRVLDGNPAVKTQKNRARRGKKGEKGKG